MGMFPNADEEENPLPNAHASGIRVKPSSGERMQPPPPAPLIRQGYPKRRMRSRHARGFLVCSKCVHPPRRSPHRSAPAAALTPRMPGYTLDPSRGDARVGLKGRKRDI